MVNDGHRFLVVTNGAIRLASDLMDLHQIERDVRNACFGVTLWGGGGFDGLHREDLISRTNVGFRIAMAGNAPFHVERFGPPHQRHLVDAAVAFDAADSLRHVDAVIEVSEVGEIVNAGPGDRLAGAVTRADDFQLRAVGPDLRVAGHAGRRRRDTGEGARFHRGVAVATIDAKARDVMLVTELDRLRPHDADLRRVGRTKDEPNDSANASEDEHRAKNAGAGDGVHTRMKDLGHRSDANLLSIAVQVGYRRREEL